MSKCNKNRGHYLLNDYEWNLCEMESILSASREVHLRVLSETVWAAKLFLKWGAMWPCDNDWLSRLGKRYYVIISTLEISFQLRIFYLYRTNLDVLVGASFSTFVIVCAFTKCICSSINKKYLAEIVQSIFNEFWPVDAFDNRDEALRLLKLAKYLFWTLNISSLITCFIWVLFPFNKALPSSKRNHAILTGFPDWMHEEEFPNFQIINAFIIVQVVFVCAAITGSDCLFIFNVANAVIQFRALACALKNITAQTEEKALNDLKCYVTYHRTLLDFCEKLRVSYNVENGMDSFVDLFLMASFLILAPKEKDFVRLYKLTLYIVVIIIHMAIYCLCGSWLETEAEKVADGAYNCLWYTKSPKLRLGLIHMIRMAQRPVRLTGLSIMFMNNITLITLFKSAFSIATLFGD